MADSTAPTQVGVETYEFGPFRLEVATRTLYRQGEYTPLTPRAAEILLLLLQEAGRVVSREQLLDRVWPGLVVEEGAVANNVSILREVLDPEFDDEGPIATVSRKGYRFIAPVKTRWHAAPPLAVAPPPSPSTR